MADTDVTISSDKALKGQIKKMLLSIENKARSDDKLSDEEKGLISSTHVPLLTYLTDPQMLGVSNAMVHQLADYVGYDILMQYLQELMGGARAMLATGNYPQSTLDVINDNFTQAGQLTPSCSIRCCPSICRGCALISRAHRRPTWWMAKSRRPPSPFAAC